MGAHALDRSSECHSSYTAGPRMPKIGQHSDLADQHDAFKPDFPLELEVRS